jgi:hypothetical protein
MVGDVTGSPVDRDAAVLATDGAAMVISPYGAPVLGHPAHREVEGLTLRGFGGTEQHIQVAMVDEPHA